MKIPPALVLALTLLTMAGGFEWSLAQRSGVDGDGTKAAATPHGKKKRSVHAADEDSPTPVKRKHATPAPESAANPDDKGLESTVTPGAKKHRRKSADDDGDAAGKSSIGLKETPPAVPEKPHASPVPSKPTAGKEAELADKTKPKPAPTADEGPKAPSNYAPSASIPSSDLKEFPAQPERVQAIMEDALALAKQNLTYQYGSDDPANGGMDCSGAVAYLLRQHGYKDIPRDASGQYVWARQKGQFFAVISRKPGGFEFADLRPGDLMFWSGTYGVDRDPPVSHSMIYLGMQRDRGQQVMWGSSDGRTYDGKQRYGVSVFDFHMPKPDAVGSSGHPAVFLGYAHLPPPNEGETAKAKKQ